MEGKIEGAKVEMGRPVRTIWQEPGQGTVRVIVERRRCFRTRFPGIAERPWGWSRGRGWDEEPPGLSSWAGGIPRGSTGRQSPGGVTH